MQYSNIEPFKSVFPFFKKIIEHIFDYMAPYSKEDFIAYAQAKGLYVLGKNDEDLFVECGVDAFLGYGMYNTFFNHYEAPDESYKDKLELLMRLIFRGCPDAVVIANSKDIGSFAQWFPPGYSGTSIIKYIFAGGWKLPFMKGGITTMIRSGSVESYSFQKKKAITKNEDIYLYNLAVGHNMQRKHLAAKLVSVMQEYAQTIGRSCYLETYDPKNVRVYEHLGFKLMGESQAPNSDLTHYPFLKLPE